MQFLLTILIVTFCAFKASNANFISLISSPGHFSSPFKLLLQSSNLSSPSTIVLSYKDELKFIKLSGKQKFFSSLLDFSPKSGRNVTFNMKIFQQQESDRNLKCSSKTFTLKKLQNIPSTFVQFAKPIYRPNDVVKFHVIIIDNEGGKVHANAIKIVVRDSRGFEIKRFTDLRGQADGLYIGEFEIGDDVNVGEWKVSVKVNNDERTRSEGKFMVERYSMSFIDVRIDVDEEIYLKGDEFEVGFKAEFVHGGKVEGKFNIKFLSVDGEEIYSKKYSESEFKEKFNVKNDLKLEFEDKAVEIVIEVSFEDSQTNLKIKKSKTVKIYEQKLFKIVSLYPNPFIPGKLFNFNLKILDQDENFLQNSSEVVKVSSNNKLIESYLHNGIANFESQTQREDSKLDFVISFKGQSIKDTIFPSKKVGDKFYGNIISDAIDVKIENEILKIGDNIKVKLQSPTLLNKISVTVPSKLGIVYAETVDCDDDYECQFYVKSTHEMAPQSTISVYSMDEVERIYRGSTKLKFDELRYDDYLKVEPSSLSASPGDEISFRISSKPQSTVTMIAIDKRLSFLYDNQNFFKNFLSRTFSKPYSYVTSRNSDGYFDGKNLILIDDLKSWHKCEVNELEMLKTKFDIEEFEEEVKTSHPMKVSKSFEPFLTISKSSPDTLRSNFTEIFIYETFDLNDEETLIKTFKLPDSMTAWRVYAYSISKFGTAFIEPFDVVVRKEFYIEVILPENPKFGEILKVYVIAFNNLQSKEEVNVNIKLEGIEEDFDLRDGISCKKVRNDFELLKSVKFMKSAIFHVKPKKDVNELKLKFIADAKSESGTKFQDSVEKVLKIQSDIIKRRDAYIDLINFKDKNRAHKSFEFKADNAKKQSIRLSVELSGNILPQGLKYKEHEALQLAESGIQSIARFSKAFFIYKYLQSAKKLGSRQKLGLEAKLKSRFEDIVTTYRHHNGGFYVHNDIPTPSIWLTAYIANIFGQAMQLKAIDSDSDIIIEALNFLKDHQHPQGNFSENFLQNLPSNPDQIKDERNFHVTCFVAHAFMVNRWVLTEELENVLQKSLKFIEYEMMSVDDSYDVAFAAFLMSHEHPEIANCTLNYLEKSSHTDGKIKFYKRSNPQKTSAEMKILITCYAIRAYIKLNKFSEVETALRWLIQEKDEKGNFQGIFDTNLALETLTEVENFSQIDQAEISVKFSTNGILQDGQRTEVLTMDLNSPKFIDFPVEVQNFSMAIEGKGFAMITIHSEYLTPVKESFGGFNIEVNEMIIEGTKVEFKVCANFTEEKEHLFQAILEIELDGFKYDPASDPMMQNEEINNVQVKREGKVVKIEFEDSSIKFSCLKIMAIKDDKVTDFDTKKSSARVYNFYKKENFAAQYFEIKPHECI